MKKIMHFAQKLAYFAPLVLAAKVRAQSIGFPTDFAGFATADIITTIENIVRIVVGFLGIITVLIILIGGFKWLTSGGNEDKIADAKKLISAGVIGLIITLAAYAIANFVVKSLVGAFGS